MKLHRELGITQKSGYFMAQRLREAWSSGENKMGGPLEVDETFMGGKEKASMSTRETILSALREKP